MTTDITPPLLRSVAAWCNTQTDPNVDAFARADAAATLSSLADGLEHSAATEAVDLDVAILIADTVDGTPDDYLEAAAAIREHYATPVDAELAPPPAAATIPAGATGLKGRKARLIEDSGFLEGVEVTIGTNSPNEHGKLGCRNAAGDSAFIAASSLTLIPDEPELVEPPVGTRLRDKYGVVWVRDLGAPHARWRQVDGVTGWTWSEVQNFGPLHQVWESWADVPKGVIVTDRIGDRFTGIGPCASTLGDTVRAPFVAVLPFGEADQ